MNKTLIALAVAALVASGPLFAQQTSRRLDPPPRSTIATRTSRIASPTARRPDSSRRAKPRTRKQRSQPQPRNYADRAPMAASSHRRSAASQPPAEPAEQLHLQRQAQRQHRALRQQRSRPAPRKPAGSHRARHSQRPDDCRGSRSHRESRAGHQPAGPRRSPSQRRQIDRPGKRSDQPRTEWRQPPDLSPKAQQSRPTQITHDTPVLRAEPVMPVIIGSSFY